MEIKNSYEFELFCNELNGEDILRLVTATLAKGFSIVQGESDWIIIVLKDPIIPAPLALIESIGLV